MTDQRMRLDIRIVKYENYVKKNPHKAYGYYCLGKLHLISEQYKKAEDYFQKALAVNNRYMMAAIGLMEAYVYRAKYLKAVKLYEKYADWLSTKKIYERRICRALSRYYDTKRIKAQMHGLLSQLLLSYAVQKMQKYIHQYQSGEQQKFNLVAGLLLCIYYLSNDGQTVMTEEITNIFLLCVRLDGMEDRLRWKIIRELSVEYEEILESDDIAAMFDTIPDGCSGRFVNKVFGAALKQRDIRRVRKMYNSNKNMDGWLSLPNLWTYVSLCKDSDVYDSTVYQCCSRLLKEGWVDKMVVDSIQRLKEAKVIEGVVAEESILELYGYQ